METALFMKQFTVNTENICQMKIKLRTVFLILLIMSISTQLFATAQFSDILILNNEKEKLFANPLESVFFKNPKLKEKYNAIISKYDVLTSTACWRGYVATFEIIGSALYIADITVKIAVTPTDKTKNFQSKDISIFSELFESEKPVLCDYSGMLTVPQGKMVKYVHGGYLSEYEKYILIKITAGKVINKGEYLLQEYKDKRDKAFEAFCKSGKYEDCWNAIKNGFAESISEETKRAIMKETEDFYLYDFFEF